MRLGFKKRYLLYSSAFLLFCEAVPAEDICVLRGLDFPIYEEVLEGFWKTLGKSPSRCNEVLKDRESQVLKRLNDAKPQLILALGNSSVSFIQKNFPQTPMVFGMATDIRSGSSLQGVVMDVPFSEQIRLVRRVLPELSRVSLIYSVKNRGMADQFRQTAQGQGLSINAHVINDPHEALGVIPNFRGDELMWILPDQGVVTSQNWEELFRLARDSNLKIYAFSPIYLKGASGGDLSVALNWKDHGTQIANLVKKVLAKPDAQHPIESPEKVRLYLKEGRGGFRRDIADLEMIP